MGGRRACRQAEGIYLDNGATTLRKPMAVYTAVSDGMKNCGSVGRGSHKWAMQAAQTVHNCRKEAGLLFDAEPEQVVFTQNATHGLNIALASLCREGTRVVISGYEHNAVLRPLVASGAKIQVVGRKLFDPQGALEEFEKAIREGAEVAVCNCCSNVFGYVLPYGDLGELCRKREIPLILDASQAAGVLPISLRESGAAFIAMPGHKGLYGPQGTGLLLCAAEGRPLLYGGTGGNSRSREMPEFLPDRLEAGTHNVWGIAGLLEGLRYVRKRGTGNIFAKEQELMKLLCKELEGTKGLRLYKGRGQIGVLSLRIEGRDCGELAQALADRGIAVRAGLHCAPLAHESAGTAPMGTLRLSLSDFTEPRELQGFGSVWKKLF
ncbi:MAG: aminotransferase class V-fold PLP-dependent enzyme [Oscillospiraceae bacterium]|nr:aminotransferase class V-fold PLP-dependent enzyme [Oscillospiraceae bacterium]